jgi:hypothetical protein
MESYSTDVGAIIGHFGELAIDMIAHPDRSITGATNTAATMITKTKGGEFPSKNGFHVC